MKIRGELKLSEVNTWGNAEIVKNIIIRENLEEEFEVLIPK